MEMVTPLTLTRVLDISQKIKNSSMLIIKTADNWRGVAIKESSKIQQCSENQISHIPSSLNGSRNIPSQDKMHVPSGRHRVLKNYWSTNSHMASSGTRTYNSLIWLQVKWSAYCIVLVDPSYPLLLKKLDQVQNSVLLSFWTGSSPTHTLLPFFESESVSDPL